MLNAISRCVATPASPAARALKHTKLDGEIKPPDEDLKTSLMPTEETTPHPHYHPLKLTIPLPPKDHSPRYRDESKRSHRPNEAGPRRAFPLLWLSFSSRGSQVLAVAAFSIARHGRPVD